MIIDRHRNKHEIRPIQLIAINMKQADSINRNIHELIAVNMKQTGSINRNKHETDRLDRIN